MGISCCDDRRDALVDTLCRDAALTWVTLTSLGQFETACHPPIPRLALDGEGHNERTVFLEECVLAEGLDGHVGNDLSVISCESQCSRKGREREEDVRWELGVFLSHG